MQNFITLGQPLMGEKYLARKEEKKEKKNNPKNSGNFVPLQRLRAVQALRSDQFAFENLLGEKIMQISNLLYLYFL